MRYQDLVNKLINRRHELHLSQQYVADMSDLYQPSIAKYEKYRSIMQLKSLLAIMRSMRLRLMVDGIQIMAGADLFGIINKARLRQHVTLEELGYCSTAYYFWDQRRCANMNVDRLLGILAYLHIQIRITEE